MERDGARWRKMIGVFLEFLGASRQRGGMRARRPTARVGQRIQHLSDLLGMIMIVFVLIAVVLTAQTGHSCFIYSDHLMLLDDLLDINRLLSRVVLDPGFFWFSSGWVSGASRRAPEAPERPTEPPPGPVSTKHKNQYFLQGLTERPRSCGAESGHWWVFWLVAQGGRSFPTCWLLSRHPFPFCWP